MSIATWHSTAALAWLQTLLQERFGHLFELQVQPDGNCITMQLSGDTRCVTLALDGATFTRADSDLPCATWPAPADGWVTALPGNLPAPGAVHLSLPLIEATVNGGWHIGYDILGLTYWMLTRQEEVGRTDLDAHGRFPASSSHAWKHDYLERPIVDEWLYVLGQVIARTWPGMALKEHQFSMKVSHDVDAPSRYGFASAKGLLRSMASDVLKRGDIPNALRAPWIRLNTRDALHLSDPFNTFEWIMDLSDQHGLSSAFYFICGRSSNMDADYEPEHPAIRRLMRRIHERGHEIGLHPSYGTYQKPELITHEAGRLRTILAEENIQQTEIGGRMHYLRWEQPTTLRAWADAGMDYDSTLGYADRPGFRCGTCFEYPAFDPVADEALKLRVRPLVVMECSVIDVCYLGLGTGALALAKVAQLKDACKAVQGCFTVLWHNSTAEYKAKKFYESSLDN
ncbi:polysaccharide deacetylase family protein [Comamonas avium]|uniref:Polysaccharide deacetylase family protein n=1 Tax=Comamonas avium TaxID=2762231 RepID=A0ABR8SA12_9BURK|nr:polysaccharide deacetylase family protein [Comamonas avium]MBD7960324.1 polysaccharide deacetylase family protein [Comamonas avium]